MLSGFSLAVAMALLCVVPYHVVASYRFCAAFPLNQRSRGWWRGLELFAYAAAFLVWLPGAYSAFVRVFGPEHAIASAYANYPLPIYAELAYLQFGILFGAMIGLLQVAVCWRNYQQVSEPDLRRRTRWVFVGMASPLLAVLLLAPFLLVVASPSTRLFLVHLIDVFAVISPLCIAYAVFKHRVLGIRMVLRAGVQYMLAKNVLRFGLAVPAVILLAIAVANPGLTLAQLAVGPTGKLGFLLLVLTVVALKYRTSLLNRIDRHFFREAYHRDQVFIALTEAIRRAADIPEVSRLLSTEIQRALHPRAIFAVSREGPEDFAMVYSSSQDGSRSVQEFGISAATVDGLESTVDVHSFPVARRSQFAALETLGIELLVPIRSPNEGLVGLLLLGPKMSEEPYSRDDRNLLDSVASQTGIAWENLELRQRLQREKGVREKVVASIEGGTARLLMECPGCGACYDGDVGVCQQDGRALTATLPITRNIEGKYLLTRLIGRGGMGAVYKAKDLRLDRSVAVKIMIGELFGRSTALRRFEREARASAKIDHPNVVRIYDLGEFAGGGAYLVLEFLHGTTLRHELRRRGAIPPHEAAAVLLGVFRGVEAAHQHHVIHRDLKPDNIFLARVLDDASCVAKILDFGLAVVRDLEFSDGRRLTQPGNAIGTLAYMSREQFLGQQVDERTDIYSLAIVALEALTGEIKLNGSWFNQLAPVVQRRLCGASATTLHRRSRLSCSGRWMRTARGATTPWSSSAKRSCHCCSSVHRYR